MRYFILFLLLSQYIQAQVGIGTVTPEATLDVREPNPSSPTSFAGIAVPQITNLPTTGNRAGQIVILTTNNKFYYFDGSSWECLNCSVTWGDVKQSFNTIDHDGWILLDGRTLTSLTATQQNRATALGFVSNLPNADDRVLKTKGAINSTGGNNSATLTQSNLPNVNFTGITNTTGAHTHNYTDRGDTAFAINSNPQISPIADNTSSTYSTESSGNHSHTVEVNSGGNGTPLNIENQYLSVNAFIYLGF